MKIFQNMHIDVHTDQLSKIVSRTLVEANKITQVAMQVIRRQYTNTTSPRRPEGIFE
jgi:hypothetical protein